MSVRRCVDVQIASDHALSFVAATTDKLAAKPLPLQGIMQHCDYIILRSFKILESLACSSCEGAKGADTRAGQPQSAHAFRPQELIHFPTSKASSQQQSPSKTTEAGKNACIEEDNVFRATVSCALEI